jgi:hypothetical protein
VSLKTFLVVVMIFRVSCGNAHRDSQNVALLWLLLEFAVQ